MSSGYSVASASQLRGTTPLPREPTDRTKLMEDFHKGQLKRSSAVRKSVRFTKSTIARDEFEEEVDNTDIFTQSPHASRGSMSSIDLPEGLAYAQPVEDPPMELLRPVAYIPGSDTEQSAAGHGARETGVVEVHQANTHRAGDHKRSSSNSSTSSTSSRRHRRSGSFEIYFTPVEATKSQIYLSSPVASPIGSPSPSPSSSLPPTPEVDEDPCPTPKPSARLSRPPSAIYIGTPPAEIQPGGFPQRCSKASLSISQTQLNSLISALAQSRVIQKHVRKDWFEVEDIPDDQSTSSGASLPTLTSASTLYSRQNENFYERRASRIRRTSPRSGLERRAQLSLDVPYGGVSLCDHKIHGSPAKFVSSNYKLGPHMLNVGTCQFLDTPAGPEVECSIRLEQAHSGDGSCVVLLRYVNQVVDRKTGKNTYLLSGDVEVTQAFTKAALAELAGLAGKSVEDIDVLADNAPGQAQPDSPDIDWVALADELQLTADITDLLESTLTYISTDLTEESASMKTLSLLSSLTLIADQHQDLLILRPTAFHENGRPANVQIPWVSQRLYEDWYTTKNAPGYCDAARQFQQKIVANVAKKSLDKAAFSCAAYWDEEPQIVHCVPVSNEKDEVIWLCFVRGEFGAIEI